MPASRRILAIECATPHASVAVLHGTRVLAEREEASGQHAATVLGLVDAVLQGAGLELAAIEAFAVSKGPGAFTNLRVGLATIKGLAFASDREVAGISTLEALAWQVSEGGPAEGPIAALLDARRGECYAGAYERRGERLEAVFSEGVYSAEDLDHQLPETCRVAGSGADLYAEKLGAAPANSTGRMLAAGLAPRARDVGVLGAHALARGEGVLAELLEPDYLRGANARLPRGALPSPAEAS